VKNVNQVDYLNLFINSLKEEERGKELAFMRPENHEDVIKKEHELQMAHGVHSGKVHKDNKINIICEALKEELVKFNQ
jgi:hypothetical protein